MHGIEVSQLDRKRFVLNRLWYLLAHNVISIKYYLEFLYKSIHNLIKKFKSI